SQLWRMIQRPGRRSGCAHPRREGSPVRHSHLRPAEVSSDREWTVSTGTLQQRDNEQCANQFRCCIPVGRMVPMKALPNSHEKFHAALLIFSQLSRSGACFLLIGKRTLKLEPLSDPLLNARMEPP